MKESFGYIEFQAEDCDVISAAKIYKDALDASKSGTSDNDF